MISGKKSSLRSTLILALDRLPLTSPPTPILLRKRFGALSSCRPPPWSPMDAWTLRRSTCRYVNKAEADYDFGVPARQGPISRPPLKLFRIFEKRIRRDDLAALAWSTFYASASLHKVIQLYSQPRLTPCDGRSDHHQLSDSFDNTGKPTKKPQTSSSPHRLSREVVPSTLASPPTTLVSEIAQNREL